MTASSSARNQDSLSQTQIDALIRIVLTNPLLNTVFRKTPHLNLPEYYIGAGCIAQSVWNHSFGMPIDNGIRDIDWVYYDPDLSYDKECEVIDSVRREFDSLAVRLDIKNQARVHLWYEQHFGYPIEPFSSLEEAIRTWPTTATAIGMRMNPNKEWKVYAPFGLSDLFSLTVRANKVQITEEIYERKINRWKAIWPGLTVIPWE
ncbi:nucleotidyltransferase family protein [Cohnella sp. CBP 2801]|uniref:Nucleotidyltransferase family protein n=1 Tax=Cohnella zeiphila TaxID=2761120 RepID=A0A7X0VZD7_9BACL|nr:nucleotidyltransferase family protein [Cohnella zeiphila]